MKVLYWNVYIGQSPRKMRRTLRKLIQQHQPDIIGLGEADRCYSITQSIKGYDQYAIKPTYRGSCDTIALVRNDVDLRRTYWLNMTKWWTGPKHGLVQGPKHYWAGRVKAKDGNIYRVSIGHWPFNNARAETEDRVAGWFHAVDNDVTSIHLGDLNTKPEDMDRYVKRFAGQHDGVFIDRAMFKNCRVRVKNLGKFGSDHPAVLFTFYK